jgi:hypothetical protein
MRKGFPENKSKSESTSLNVAGLYAKHAAVRLTNDSMTGRLANFVMSRLAKHRRAVLPSLGGRSCKLLGRLAKFGRAVFANMCRLAKLCELCDGPSLRTLGGPLDQPALWPRLTGLTEGLVNIQWLQPRRLLKRCIDRLAFGIYSWSHWKLHPKQSKLVS